MAWVLEAYEKGNLRMTSEMMCPYCNPKKKKDVDAKLNACEKHNWVNNNWFKWWYEDKFGEVPEISDG